MAIPPRLPFMLFALSYLPCMYVCVCIHIYGILCFQTCKSLCQIQQENQLQVGVICSQPLSLQTPKDVCVTPPVLLPVLHCFQCKQPATYLPSPFTCPLTVVEKMSCESYDFFLSLCLLVITNVFFSGEWCPAHPSVAISCPVDSCYSLWRSQSLGPDEQGLIHLTGRYLATSNRCRENGRS